MSFIKRLEKEEYKIRKENDSNLLADLIYMNDKLSAKKYDDTITGISLLKTLHDEFKYTQKDNKDIVERASVLLKEKYNLELIDFNNLILKKLK